MIRHIYPPDDTFEHKPDGTPCECLPEFDVDEHGDIVVTHNPVGEEQEFADY